jgi:hypothetical protein
MTVFIEDEQQRRLEELASALRSFDATGDYFAATLLAKGDRWSLRFDTAFAGWPDGVEPAPTTPELREPCLVDPGKMVALWESVGQSRLAVDHPAELAAYFRLGGNALIARDIAQTHLSEFTAPQVLVKSALVGLSTYNSTVEQHRPSPKLRLRILKRDGYRCQLCGERPSLNEHIVLVVHHIRPFQPHGLTAEENLITICHTCHGGLDPHEDLDLYLIPGGHLDWVVGVEGHDQHTEAVHAYRMLVRRVRAQGRT